MPGVLAGVMRALAAIRGPTPQFEPFPLAAEPDGDGSQK
jgi:hypothetical protein